MYAIVESGGKQFRVSEGDVIRTDLIETEVGASVTFDRVVPGRGLSPPRLLRETAEKRLNA